MDSINLITSCQLLPLATLTSRDQVEPICKVLTNVGLPLIEVTLRDEKTLDILDEFKKYPQITLGVGTIRTTHQIDKAPNGLRIKTPAGVILHTGDWKVDPNPLIGENINEKRLKEIGNEGVLAMICDSTNVFSAGRSGSELDVRKNMLNVMSRLKKRIIITSFASNVARMETAFYCATNRKTNFSCRKIHASYL